MSWMGGSDRTSGPHAVEGPGSGCVDSPRPPTDLTGPAPPDDLRLSGSPTGDEPGWTDRRVATWLGIFMALGIALRLVRFGLVYPLWRDEAYLVANLLERDFAGLTTPLDYQQVCPLFFLWAEEAIG